MTRWTPIQYRLEGKQKAVSENVIEAALQQAHNLQDKCLPAILTLNHLAFHIDVPYIFLRKTISRQNYPYRTFPITKRKGGYRYINVPSTNLLRTQKWIDKFILSKVPDSPYSYAYRQGQSIVKCAEQHLGCTWLIKIDLRHFFESLSEIQVYHVFLSIGYGQLIAFEMARLCTKVLDNNSRKYEKSNWVSQYTSSIMDYKDRRIGHLPQGAPTSPKLANAIVYKLDFEIAEVVKKYGLTFTRYADDIAVSTASKEFSREKGVEIIHAIYSILPKYGLKPNPQKAQIIPPGARKIVLGLLVDSPKVRLSKQFKSKLECQFYFCAKNPIEHAQNRGFRSVLGLKNYVMGLLAYAKQIDPKYVDNLIRQIDNIKWPL